MALLLALVLLGLVLVDDDLLALDLREDLALDAGAGDHGRADFGLVATDHEYLVTLPRIARMTVALPNEDQVALLMSMIHI